ncbi:MAG TPA: methyltransferase, partial [Nocardioides sp.]|nr:methyltransferase [Nocardioides sp.]
VPPLLRWRTRMRYVALPDGRRGLHVHRSDEVVEIEDCLIDASGDPSRRSGDLPRPSSDLPRPSGDLPRRSSGVETTETVRTSYGTGDLPRPSGGLPRRSGDLARPSGGVETTETVRASYGTRDFAVAPDGFWQSHVEAPRVLVETVLGMLRPEPGERVLDLYAGVGLFAAFLADAVGPSGRVVAVEGSRIACRDARANLPPSVRVEHGPVDRVLASSYDEPFDLVLLDPPREGARREVVEQVADRAPRAVAYVACDPAALARDLATFGSLGYAVRDFRAFDLFPMTFHAECVAHLVKR